MIFRIFASSNFLFNSSKYFNFLFGKSRLILTRQRLKIDDCAKDGGEEFFTEVHYVL